MASLIKRGTTFYIQWHVAGKPRRKSLRTDSLQVAKERLRQFEAAQAQGIENPLPTRTPIPEVLSAYVTHIRTFKTPKSAQTDVYYLREMFGACCPELEITSRKQSAAARKRPLKSRRRRAPLIEADCFERITTAQVADFIATMVRVRGLKPKTANRYREIACRVFNWAIQEGRVRMPGDVNPAARVRRYKEPAPKIRYLTLAQIDEQINALAHDQQLQTMVAVLIYAGLRREEALWLTDEDVLCDADPRG